MMTEDHASTDDVLNDLLKSLRADGCSKISSTRLTMTLTGVSMCKAKVIVHNSEA